MLLKVEDARRSDAYTQCFRHTSQNTIVGETFELEAEYLAKNVTVNDKCSRRATYIIQSHRRIVAITPGQRGAATSMRPLEGRWSGFDAA